MEFTVLHILEAAAIGLLAGTIGGLAGIGGSLIMLPLLGFWFGYGGDVEATRHHMYGAAAMAVNVLVSLPAAWRHARAGSVDRRLVRWMMPPMIVTIVLGVLVSERFSGRDLKLFLAAFIIVYCVINVVRAVRNTPDHTPGDMRAPATTVVGIGAFTGFLGGLLQIGGGIVIVPLLQVLCRVPLRRAIGTSSTVMCVTAVFGAAMKFYGLRGHGQSTADALALVAAMGPTAILGGVLGATLTHRLPLQQVRIVIAFLLIGFAVRLAGIL